MPANTAPIYSLTPKIGIAVPSAVCTKSDGSGTIGTDLFVAFTAGSNGSWVSRARIWAVATTAATTTNATVARLFASSQASGATTNLNTFLLAEVGLASVVADHSTNQINVQEVPINIALPAGWTILASIHLANAANSLQQFSVFGGDY